VGATKSLRAPLEDMLGRCVRIAADFVVPQPQDGPALVFEKTRTPGIIGGSVSMLAAVQLNSQLCLAASEVEDIWLNDQLTREARPELGESAPEQAFGLGGSVAELAGSGREMFGYAAHNDKINWLAALAYPPLTPPLQGGEKLQNIADLVLRAGEDDAFFGLDEGPLDQDRVRDHRVEDGIIGDVAGGQTELDGKRLLGAQAFTRRDARALVEALELIAARRRLQIFVDRHLRRTL
jgi:hypothetical protein